MTTTVHAKEHLSTIFIVILTLSEFRKLFFDLRTLNKRGHFFVKKNFLRNWNRASIQYFRLSCSFRISHKGRLIVFEGMQVES